MLTVLRRVLAPPKRVDELEQRRGRTSPLTRVVVKIASLVFPVNSSGNNRSMR